MSRWILMNIGPNIGPNDNIMHQQISTLAFKIVSGAELRQVEAEQL